jgi:hypothetical protein
MLTMVQGKDQAADDIKSTLPELAKKTTFLWVGLFTSNFWSYPMMKPIEIVSTISESTNLLDPNNDISARQLRLPHLPPTNPTHNQHLLRRRHLHQPRHFRLRHPRQTTHLHTRQVRFRLHRARALQRLLASLERRYWQAGDLRASLAGAV